MKLDREKIKKQIEEKLDDDLEIATLDDYDKAMLDVISDDEDDIVSNSNTNNQTDDLDELVNSLLNKNASSDSEEEALEIEELELTRKSKKELGIRTFKIPWKIIIPVLLVITIINPFKIKPIENIKYSVQTTYYKVVAKLKANQKVKDLLSTGEDLNIIENEDYRGGSFSDFNNEVKFNLDVEDIEKDYYVVFETKKKVDEIEQQNLLFLFQGLFQINEILSEEDCQTNCILISLYDYNALYNYNSDKAVFVAKFENFNDAGIYSFKLNTTSEEFDSIKNDFDIFVRKEY